MFHGQVNLIHQIIEMDWTEEKGGTDRFKKAIGMSVKNRSTWQSGDSPRILAANSKLESGGKSTSQTKRSGGAERAASRTSSGSPKARASQPFSRRRSASIEATRYS